MAYPRFRKGRAHKRTLITRGNVSVANSGTVGVNSWVAISTLDDLTIRASVGDDIEVHVQAFYGNENAEVTLDVCTMVAGSPVTSIGGQATATVTANRAGFQACDQLINNYMGVHGMGYWTITTPDLSSGKVTVRPYACCFTTSASRTVRASASNPFLFVIKNLGPVSPH